MEFDELQIVNPWKGLFRNKSEEGKEKTIAHGEVEYIGGHGHYGYHHYHNYGHNHNHGHNHGGHKAYPSSVYSKIYFYEDRMEIGALKLVIPYRSIKNLDNSREKKRHEDWAVMGLLGYALWKRNAVYTLIEYYDGIDIQKIILDFHNNVDYAQGLIYKKMLEFRNKEK